MRKDSMNADVCFYSFSVRFFWNECPYTTCVRFYASPDLLWVSARVLRREVRRLFGCGISIYKIGYQERSSLFPVFRPPSSVLCR